MSVDTKIILQQQLEDEFVGLEYRQIIKRAIALHFKNEEDPANYQVIKEVDQIHFPVLWIRILM
jgi:hypothetical protein